jgi:NitT/TauT family transport system substrate-binding protein
LLAVLVVVPSAIAVNAHKSARLTNVSVQLGWLPQTEFAGYYAAAAQGFYKSAGLNVNVIPGGPQLTATSVVASGGATFGAGLAPFDVLAADGQGLKLEQIAIGAEQDELRLVSLKKLGITRPKQLEGKTVGVFVGTGEEEMKIMVLNDGGNPNKVNWVSQGASLAPIINGTWGAGMATVYNELNLLKEQNVAVNVMNPATYHTAFPGDGIAVAQSYAAKNPSIVTAFLAATMQGWRWAFLHKQQAVADVTAHAVGLTAHHQLLMLTSMQGLMCTGPALTHGMGYFDPAVMTNALTFLTKYKVGKAPSSTAGTYSNTYINAVPAADKSCSGL